MVLKFRFHSGMLELFQKRKRGKFMSENTVPKQTLYTAIAISLLVGFVSGAMYSSFKLAGPGQLTSGAGTGTNAQSPNDHEAEFAEKIKEVETYLEQHPQDADAWTRLGNLFYDTEQPKKAINAYQKSLAIKPEEPGVITDMGYMYLMAGQPEKAIEIFDKALEVNPAFEPAMFNKGVVFIQALNDHEAGIEAWEKLIEVNPMAKTSRGQFVSDLIESLRNQKK